MVNENKNREREDKIEKKKKDGKKYVKLGEDKLRRNY